MILMIATMAIAVSAKSHSTAHMYKDTYSKNVWRNPTPELNRQTGITSVEGLISNVHKVTIKPAGYFGMVQTHMEFSEKLPKGADYNIDKVPQKLYELPAWVASNYKVNYKGAFVLNTNFDDSLVTSADFKILVPRWSDNTYSLLVMNSEGYRVVEPSIIKGSSNMNFMTFDVGQWDQIAILQSLPRPVFVPTIDLPVLETVGGGSSGAVIEVETLEETEVVTEEPLEETEEPLEEVSETIDVEVVDA